MGNYTRDLHLIALKLVAENTARLAYKDGIIIMTPRTSLINGKGAFVPSVFMETYKFFEYFEDRDFHYTEDGEYVYLIDDGIQFYALVDKNER